MSKEPTKSLKIKDELTDFLEGIIERRNTLTMEGFSESVNKFLEFNEYQILEGF
jgi:hypothetical protein